MKTICYFLFIAFTSCSGLKANIIEIENISSILPLVDNETLVIFDIDNTLMQGQCEVATASFFNHLFKEMKALGMSDEKIIDEVYPIWMDIQKIAEVDPVDKITPYIIKDLKKREIPILAITNRGPDLAYRTLDQLKSVGIDLTQNGFHPHNLIIGDHSIAKYLEGVLFVSPFENKAEKALKLFQTIEFNPKKIICLDHNLESLVGMKDYFKKQDIAFLGLHYTICDKRDIDMEVACFQLEYLGKILSDNVAKAIVTSKQSKLIQS